MATFHVSDRLSPKWAEQLYGAILRTSVTRLEDFASCPFKFFIRTGLRAEERRLLDLDKRMQGSFQHLVLAEFHRQLQLEHRRWRDLSPREAGERLTRVAATVAETFENGLLKDNALRAFVTRSLTRSLREFIQVIVAWMPQNQFDPHQAELAFGGPNAPLPAWEIELGDGHRLAVTGKIDRVDLAIDAETNSALCLIVDFKSKAPRLDPLLLQHGIQLQLPAYLAALRRTTGTATVFGVDRLTPAGMFYVNLRGRYARGATRGEILTGANEAREAAYRHHGRFDADWLAKFDHRPAAVKGNQFRYARKREGGLSKQSHDAMPAEEFARLLDAVEDRVRQIGQEVYLGSAAVDPYRTGSQSACDACRYRSICRIDPWAHRYRLLQRLD